LDFSRDHGSAELDGSREAVEGSVLGLAQENVAGCFALDSRPESAVLGHEYKRPSVIRAAGHQGHGCMDQSKEHDGSELVERNPKNLFTAVLNSDLIIF